MTIMSVPEPGDRDPDDATARADDLADDAEQPADDGPDYSLPAVEEDLED
jgi:hypothetical protein